MAKSKKSLFIILIIIFVIVLIFFNTFKGAYNKLVALDEGVNSAWAQVENQLQRRLDLIPNLVNTVKGYAEHEMDVLTAVTNARSRVGSAQTIPEKIDANRQLTSALGRLLVVVENYPNLKADQNFLALQSQLEGTENRIAVERRRYNETTRTYNTVVRKFPDNIIANMFGFERKSFFEAAEEAKQVPEVKF